MERVTRIGAAVLALLAAGLQLPSTGGTRAAMAAEAFSYDQHTGKCVDRQGTEGLNAGVSREQLTAAKAAECADFRHARVNLTYLRLPGANLKGANFAGVLFYLGTFAGADFRGANLDGTSGQIDYRRADLRGASFLGADLTYNEFDGALLEGARFDDSTRLPFSPAEAEARGMTFVPRRSPEGTPAPKQ